MLISGIGTLINSLANNDEIRPNAYILISSTSANDVLEKVSNSGENFSSRFYEYVINSVNYTGYSVETKFGQFLNDINNDFNDAIAIYTFVNDDSIQNSGLAIFKDDYMVGKISSLDAIAHLLVIDKLEESLISIPNPFDSSSNLDLVLGITKNSKQKVNIINNTPFITCEFFVGATIKTSGQNFDYTTTENIILDYLYTLSKEYNSDVLSFKSILSRTCATNQELENYHWEDIYKDSYFKVTVNTNINSTHLFDKE